jgi:hypothetical protein
MAPGDNSVVGNLSEQFQGGAVDSNIAIASCAKRGRGFAAESEQIAEYESACLESSAGKVYASSKRWAVALFSVAGTRVDADPQNPRPVSPPPSECISVRWVMPGLVL